MGRGGACHWAALLMLASSVGRGAELEESVPTQVEVLLQSRQYAEAVQAIDRRLAASQDDADYLTYLKARALFLEGKYAQAAETFRSVEAAFPTSGIVRRARFGRALSLMRQGDFHAAEEIYRREAEYLVSPDRKEEIASIYLEFAEAFFAPQGRDATPDYHQAIEYFNKALEVGPKRETRADVEGKLARCYQELGQFDEAAHRFRRFSEEYPDHPFDIEARYRLGECQLALSQPAEARRTFEDLLSKYDQSSSPKVAESMFRLSDTHGAPRPESDEDLEQAVASLRSLLRRFPDDPLAGKAQLRIAQSYVHRQRFEDAVKALGTFLEDPRYVGREERSDALFLQGQCHQLQKKYGKAIEIWHEFLTRYPAHPSWNQAQQQIIHTEYLQGVEELTAKRYDQARAAWTKFLEKYPLDPRVPGILLAFGRMRQEQRQWQEAIADWRQLVLKHANTEEASQGQFLIASVLEQQLHDYEAALKEYALVTWGSMQEAARHAIARLTSKGLTIATERIFRTDEKPRIQLTTRNIEGVTVKVYRVDMEAYFRKMHAGQGVEQLDIALIDPDASFEYKVPDYAQFRIFEHDLEIPVPGDDHDSRSRVLAVSVHSDTLESTTMVVQSDLDVIVKSSRDEIFVFAENVRTKAPWPGARILVSSGQAIFAEGNTDKDGVFRGAFEELKQAGDVRVLALAGAECASTNVSLAGLKVAQGLSEKGYIYTERPAYRAGQLVHVRGIIRLVSNDQYLVPNKATYELNVYDSRNRLLVQEEVSLNDYGSFQQHFLLPVGAPAGTYRIVVNDRDGRLFQGEFQVHEYQLEPVVLLIDSGRHVYYRGEEIEGTFTARYRHGSPLPNRELRYQLASGRLFTTRTDAQGKASFKLSTREFRESQVLPLVVALPDQNVSAAVNFVLATQGLLLSVETRRELYVAGESLEATIHAADPEGKPAAAKLTLHVLKRTEVHGQFGEVSVSRHEVTTDKERGEARITLNLKEAGNYILRAEGIDQFDNPVSGSRTIAVSGEEDTVRLRLLADRHTFRAGEPCKVNIHWREEPALALVTFQGARILDYRLVLLHKGDNVFEFAAAAALAPNFDLSVAVMTDARDAGRDASSAPARWHEATSPFSVEQDLRIQINVIRAAGAEGTPKPGEEVEVQVVAKDSLGKPVAAEISLGVVERALWDLFPESTAPIAAFFRGTLRESAVRTASSITFAYHPRTRAISEFLLAEEDRRALAAEEAARLSELANTRFQTDIDSLTDLVASTWESEEGRDRDVLGGEGAHGYGLTEAEPGGRGDLTAGAFSGLAPGQGGGLGETRGRQQRRELFSQQAGRPTRQAFNGLEPELLMQSLSKRAPADLAERQRADLVFRNGKTMAVAGADVPVDLALSFGNSIPFAQVYQQFRDENGQWFAGDAGQGGDRVVMLANGIQATFNARVLRELGRERADELARKLSEGGGVLMPNSPVVETAYWNPVIVTDATGKANVFLLLPERSTSWQLVAKGITQDTLAGQGESELVVRKNLFGELRLPTAVVDGDHLEVLATIHHDKVPSGKVTATLETTIGDKSTKEVRVLAVNGEGAAETSFGIDLQLPPPAEGTLGAEADVGFTLTVTDGARSDVVHKVIPLLPYGERVYATSAGSAEGDVTTWVEAPSGTVLARPALSISVGPDMERSLLDVLFAPSPLDKLASNQGVPALDRATSDLMAALSLKRIVSTSREVASPEIHTLDALIRASISLLVTSQQEDGGWSWSGGAAGSNPYSTARAAWALGLARQQGMKVPQHAVTKASQYMRNMLTVADNEDFETQVVLLHGLAILGEGDYTLVNRIYRMRVSLSAPALAYLALTMAEMDRAAMAADVLSLLNERDGARASAPAEPLAKRPWFASSVELLALHALALQRIAPTSLKTRATMDRLLAARWGNRWSPDRATGPAMLALGDWMSTNRLQPGRYQLAVIVNGKEVKVLDITPGAFTQTIEVPAGALVEGRQRIQFRLTGRGRYSYQCTLAGMVPAEQLSSATKHLLVERIYEPAPLEIDGRSIPQGFDILQGSFQFFRNPLTQLPRSRAGSVRLNLHRQYTGNPLQDNQTEYFVVSEPLPSGVSVVDGSVRGNFEYYELQPGRITFYLVFGHHAEITFEVRGYLAGRYRAGPTVVRWAYDAAQYAVARPHSLEVLAADTPSGDEYRLTPRELYELGKLAFAQRNWSQAGEHLSKLIQDWNVNPDIYKEVAGILLDVHLEIGPSRDVVRYFEIIKQKWPSLELDFDKILKVGAAYEAIGEYERSFLVYRATVEGSFEQESGVPGFLDARGEFLRSVEVMNRLLREYPPEPYVAAAEFSLSQRVYTKAPEAAGDEKLRVKKVTRVMLIQQAMNRLRRFLVENPDDPAADQAAFSTANALLDLKMYPQVIAHCTRFERLYPQSAFLDSFWYLIGYCHFALGQHDQAIEMCRKVAETNRVDAATGRETESANKWRAIYIMGQVYHSLDKAADAIREYALVADRFPDARLAMEYFTRKEIALPEVTTVLSGNPAEVALRFRNVPSINVRVYRIDLLKFGLLRKNLAGITEINLSGIRPVHETDVPLGDGRDYRDRERQLALPLTQEGAYLVVCRSENLHASGFVVVTPLAMEVREDAQAGQVRLTIKDRLAGKFASAVHVKVIGSRDPTFISGETDVRGVFTAEGIHGTATILARGQDDRYAFYRGSQELEPLPPLSTSPPPKDAAPAPGLGGKADVLLEDLGTSNSALQAENFRRLKLLYERKNRGVQVEKAY